MTIRTILVDDETLAIQGLQLRLQAHEDVEIIDTCSNGREAIRSIKTHKPDLVFLDIQMPGFDGFSMIQGLMEIEPPLFVFVITIESHGTFRRNRLPPEELARVRIGRGLELPEPFVSYLRHLANADRMIGRLAEHLEHAGDGVLCAYGDHLPSFPALFRKMGWRDGRTDYLLWRAGQGVPPERRDLHVRSLARTLLAVAGAGRSTDDQRHA